MTSSIRLRVLAALALAACGRERRIPQPPPVVRVQAVELGAADGRARFSGVARPTTQVLLAFRVPGYVARLLTVRGEGGRPRPVAEGDAVKKGDVLARLRAAEYEDKVQHAASQEGAVRAAAEKARLDFARASRLFETRSIPKPDYDGARAQRDATSAQAAAAAAQLREARLALQDTSLASPIDGEVVKKAVEVGALVGAGTLAFVVADTSAVKIVIGVPDVQLRTVRVGAPVAVTTDALPGRSFAARIDRIAAAADPATRNFDVEISIPNPRREWRAGTIAAVELVGPSAPAPGPVLLPFSAIVAAPGRGDRYAVFLIVGEGRSVVARLREVELGDVVGNRIAVARGLAPGERVITVGASLLFDGERVQINP